MPDDTSAGQSAIEGLILDLVDAWNNGDRVGFGARFTAQALYVTGDGNQLQGRREIEDVAPRRKSDLAIVIEDIVVTGVDSERATASFRWEARDASGGRRHGTITFVLVHEQEQWLIEGLENAEARGEGPGPTTTASSIP